MNKKSKVKNLLEKYRDGTCSEKDLRQLLEWMDDNQEMFELLDETVKRDWRKQSLMKDQQCDVNGNQKKVWFGYLEYWVAAAFVILVFTAGFVYWFNINSETIIYNTDYGERQLIELPDGSLVELNANSQLTWDKKWQRSGVRSVVLDGEAFFDVVNRNDIEFLVKANETVTKVLGTSFNISNRRGETEVFLNEGKVELEILNVEKLIMTAGEKVAYENHTKKIVKTEQETLRSAAAWKIGVIAFQEEALKNIIPVLNDIYGLHLTCRDSILNEKIMDVGVPYTDWETTKVSLELAMNVDINKIDDVLVFELKD